MKSSNHWQAKFPGETVLTNVPVALIPNLMFCGFQVRGPHCANLPSNRAAA